MIRVKLLRQNRIDGRAGDIVEVSPARAEFLMGLGLAEPAEEREEKTTPEKGRKAGTPENGERTENPEKAKPRRNTRGK